MIRLHGIDSHVVMFSRKPVRLAFLDHAFLHTCGVSCISLAELQQMTTEKLISLSKIKSDPEQLKKLFRAEYDPNSRHSDANLFGVWQLVKAQKIYEDLRFG